MAADIITMIQNSLREWLGGRNITYDYKVTDTEAKMQVKVRTALQALLSICKLYYFLCIAISRTLYHTI